MLEENDTESPVVKRSPDRRSTAPVSETTQLGRNKVCPEGNEEDNSSTSDKKDDWEGVKNSALQSTGFFSPSYS